MICIYENMDNLYKIYDSVNKCKEAHKEKIGFEVICSGSIHGGRSMSLPIAGVKIDKNKSNKSIVKKNHESY
tara:strand:+ start:3224 stop:3439 length:216 start_codon:yes stop_codon:yes gene_type:complete